MKLTTKRLMTLFLALMIAINIAAIIPHQAEASSKKTEYWANYYTKKYAKKYPDSVRNSKQYSSESPVVCVKKFSRKKIILAGTLQTGYGKHTRILKSKTRTFKLIRNCKFYTAAFGNGKFHLSRLSYLRMKKYIVKEPLMLVMSLYRNRKGQVYKIVLSS